MGVAPAQDDRDAQGGALRVALYGPDHLDAVAAIRPEEVRAYEEDDVRRVQLSADLVRDLFARPDSPVVPSADHALAARASEMGADNGLPGGQKHSPKRRSAARNLNYELEDSTLPAAKSRLAARRRRA